MLIDRPQLRSYLTKVEAPEDSQHVYLLDRLGLAQPLALTHAEFACLEFLNGQHGHGDIQRQAAQLGKAVRLDQVQQLVARLDKNLLLDTPTFHRVVHAPDRPPRCLGVYETGADALRRQLRGLFARGAGLPCAAKPEGSLHAALVPHIDYTRGGLSYTYAFKEIFEKSDASLFVIIGTSHHSAHRFSLTRKNFLTPLGLARTDQEYVDRLVRNVGPALFADEWLAHFPEHSIELEVVFLQYLYENVRPFRIVPLVVGSFHDCVMSGQSPNLRHDIAALIDALQRAEAETKEPICYIISGDLAHIGPKFNATQRLDDALLRHSHEQDYAILHHVQAVDLNGYFRMIAAEADERNICGLPPTFATLAAAEPRSAKVLCYDRYVHPDRYESVSFASVGFYK